MANADAASVTLSDPFDASSVTLSDPFEENNLHALYGDRVELQLPEALLMLQDERISREHLLRAYGFVQVNEARPWTQGDVDLRFGMALVVLIGAYDDSISHLSTYNTILLSMLDEHHIKQSQDTETISRLVEDNRNLSTENARLHMWGKALDNAHKVDRGVIKNLNTAKSNVEIELARCQARVGCLQDALNAARYHNNHLMEERQKLWEEAKAGSRANREALRGAMNLNANKLAERPIKTENVKNE